MSSASTTAYTLSFLVPRAGGGMYPLAVSTGTLAEIAEDAAADYREQYKEDPEIDLSNHDSILSAFAAAHKTPMKNFVLAADSEHTTR